MRSLNKVTAKAAALAREHEVGEVFKDMIEELREVQSLLAEERAEVKKEAALRAELTAEVHRLRAEVERLRPLASAEMQRRAIGEMMNGGET